MFQELHWSPIENTAYCVSSNSEYSKWTVSVENNHEIFLQEMNTCDSNQSGPYPSHKLRNFTVGANLRLVNWINRVHNSHNSFFSDDPKDILVFQGGKSSGRHDDRDLVTLKYGIWSEKFEVTSEVIGIAIVNNNNSLFVFNIFVIIPT